MTHADNCNFAVALRATTPVQCSHGYDLCPKCDACTCAKTETGGPLKLHSADGPWLIRSHHWGRWHRGSDEEGAHGYTDDVLKAGVFGIRLAQAYHEGPNGRDEAVPLSKVIGEMDKRLEEIAAEHREHEGKVRALKARLPSTPAPLTAELLREILEDVASMHGAPQ